MWRILKVILPMELVVKRYGYQLASDVFVVVYGLRNPFYIFLFIATMQPLFGSILGWYL